MNSVFVILIVTLVTFTFAQYGPVTDCNYNFSVVLAWTNDKLYNYYPYIIGDWDFIEDSFGYSSYDLSNLRVDALEWFNEEFGIPISGAEYNPFTKITTIPGWGTLESVAFTDCYELIASNGIINNFGNPFAPKFLTFFEFTLFTFPSAAGTQMYGGRYGALYDELSTVPYVVSGDQFSYGYYYVYDYQPLFGEPIKKIFFKAKLPNRYDMSFRANDELYLEDGAWGSGVSLTRLRNATIPNGKLYHVFDTIWKFPEPLDIYQLFGIS